MDSLMQHLIALVSDHSAATAAVAAALVSAIWQGTILAALVALCLRMMPRLSAAVRSLIWMNVFVLLILLHLIPAFLVPAQANPASLLGHTAELHLTAGWSIALAGAWATLFPWRTAQLIVSAIRLHLLASRATPMDPAPALLALLESQTKEGKRARSAQLCTSLEVERPSVFGFFRPRILVPVGLLEALNPLEQQQVVMHEMEHLHRRDDWTNLAQKIVLALFPLNPALLWVERRLCAERELACDDRVLRLSAERKTYALCLTRLAEYSMIRRGLSLALGAWERRPELARRVHRILRRPAQAMNSKAAAVVSTGLIAGALSCALVLARSPQLVSFAPVAPAALNAQSLGSPDLRAISHREREAEQASPVKYVKATLPQRRAQKRPAVVNREMQDASWRYAQSGQQWIVLTDWQTNAPPARLIFTVDHINRNSYAAVEMENGWLLIQI